jgi:hypothetical protein
VRPLHVVVVDAEEDTALVVTVYEPSAARWDATFQTGRPR